MGCFEKKGARMLGKVLPAAVFAFGFLFCGNLTAGVPNDVCANCHDISESFHNTAHGIYFAQDPTLADNSCEACHGSAVDHVNDGDPALIINPAKAEQFGSSQLCLKCHNDHKFDDWAFSAHNGGDVNCASCHKVHTEAGAKPTTPDLCYSCHGDVRAAAYMPSHHPIAEGKIDCQDCHNVHGGATSFVQDATGQELCYSCHAEKEGPFVFEHAPVEEGCMTCHSPHGTVADNLLKQTEPALCLNCHPMHFHATIEGVDGSFTPPLHPDRTTVSTPDGFKKAMLTKCTECHTAIHGTDLPSQTVTTGGNTLTR